MKTWIVAALLGIAAGSAAAESLVKTKRGYAEDAASGEALYVEEHEQVIVDGETVSLVIRYRDPDGDQFAEKNLDFRADYQRPLFSLVDDRRNYREGLRLTDQGLEVFCVQNGENRSKLLEKAEFVADAGFDRIIEKRWDEMVEGKTVKFNFLVPAREGTVKFRVRKTAEMDFQGVPAVEFTMAPANALVRWIVDPIVVLYDVETKALLKYRGISNLRGPNNKNYDVVINFPPEERAQRAGQALAQAK